MKMHCKEEIFLPALLFVKLHCQIVWCECMWFQESKHSSQNFPDDLKLFCYNALTKLSL